MAASQSALSAHRPGISWLVTLPRTNARGAAKEGRELCAQLESGAILFFARTPIPLDKDDLEFLPGLKQSDAHFHKNMASRPVTDRVTGARYIQH
jgi:hypothetical protein